VQPWRLVAELVAAAVLFVRYSTVRGPLGIVAQAAKERLGNEESFDNEASEGGNVGLPEDSRGCCM